MTHSSYDRREGGTLAEARAGNKFIGIRDGKEYLVTRTGAPAGLEAIDLATGKARKPWAYTTKVAALLTPTPDTDWVGVYEAAEILGIERSRFPKWIAAGIVPEPAARLACGPVWFRWQIEAVRIERERRRNR